MRSCRRPSYPDRSRAVHEVQVFEHEEDLRSAVSITWIAGRRVGPEMGIDPIRRMQRPLSTPEVGGNARVVACSFVALLGSLVAVGGWIEL